MSCVVFKTVSALREMLSIPSAPTISRSSPWGLDCDSEIVAHVFDERNPAVLRLASAAPRLFETEAAEVCCLRLDKIQDRGGGQRERAPRKLTCHCSLRRAALLNTERAGFEPAVLPGVGHNEAEVVGAVKAVESLPLRERHTAEQGVFVKRCGRRHEPSD
jgi:hypothetical protein